MQDYHQQHHHRPQQERLLHPRLPRLGRPHLRVPHHHLNRVEEEEEVSPASGWPRHLINTKEVVRLYPNWHGIRLFSDVALIYLTIVPSNLFARQSLYTFLTKKLPVTLKTCICEACVAEMDENCTVLSSEWLLYQTFQRFFETVVLTLAN